MSTAESANPAEEQAEENNVENATKAPLYTVSAPPLAPLPSLLPHSSALPPPPPMNIFDAVYVINLDRRPERWKRTEEAIRRTGAFDMTRVYRFSAVDGQSADVQRDYKASPLQQRFAAGAYGCARSHAKVCQSALQKGQKRIVVFEDDVIFHRQFAEIVRLRFAQIPDAWQLLVLGYGVGRMRPPFSQAEAAPSALWYRMKKATNGAFAYALGEEAMKFLAEQPFVNLIPFDTGGLQHVIKRFSGRCWCASWPHPIIPSLLTSETDGSNPDTARQTLAYQNWYHEQSGWNAADYDFTMIPMEPQKESPKEQTISSESQK